MRLPTESTKVYLAFDERMSLHRPVPCSKRKYPNDETDTVPNVPYENSSRVIHLHQTLMELERRLLHENRDNLKTRRFLPVQPTPCNRATIELAHSPELYNSILRTSQLSDQQLLDLTVDDDLYYSRDTFLAATLACGGVVNCVDAVMNSHVTGIGPTRAIAIVRPPGHHATQTEAMGFCYFNNIAVAAKHAIHSGQADRVFILDWDIHHGNGIQDITYDDPNIFYLSIHRATFGTSQSSQQDWFYPGTGRPSEIGSGAGAGSNLNIVWSKGGMGNTEYAAAFRELVLPVLASFNPDLVIVAGGFDAAEGDLLGDCTCSPDMYYIMTKSVLEKAGMDTPLVVALEGGYDLDTIARCMEATALALLDEPWSEVPTVNSDQRVLGVTSIMDNSRHERMKLNRQYSLARYWKHSYLDDWGMVKNKKRTKRAIDAIQQSANALASKLCHSCANVVAIPSIAIESMKQSTPHCDFCAQRNWDPYCLRNHRPYQNRCYPFKKRRFGTDLEAASVLLQLGGK